MSIAAVFNRKRGADDIAWGLGSFTYKDPVTGTVYTIAKVNASHIPFLESPTRTLGNLVDGTNSVSIGVDDLVVGGTATITGATTLSALGLGVVHASAAGLLSSSTIVNADVNAAAGIAATKIANGTISDAEFQYLNGVTSAIQTQLDAKLAIASLATQANMEAGTSTTTWVAPGHQHFHPSACKCYARIRGEDALITWAGSYNVTSCTDNGVGDYTITIATDFANTNYVVVGMAEREAGGSEMFVEAARGGQVEGSMQILANKDTGDADDAMVHIAMFGDFA